MSTHKYTILLVDDEEDILLNLYERLKSNANFRIFTAKSGAEAYAKVKSMNIDLLITDYKMPSMNGVQLVELISASKYFQKLPVIFMSAWIEEAKSSALKDRPFTEFISKPFNLNDLETMAINLINKRTKTSVKIEADAKVMNAFIDASKNTLTTMAKLVKCQHNAPFILQPGQDLKTDVSGIIQMISAKFNGSLIISFPSDTLLQVAGRMLDSKYDKMNDEIAEAAGELLNIIWGQTRRILEYEKYDMKSAFPSVVTGAHHRIEQYEQVPTMVIPFTTECGDFYILFSLMPTQPK